MEIAKRHQDNRQVRRSQKHQCKSLQSFPPPTLFRQRQLLDFGVIDVARIPMSFHCVCLSGKWSQKWLWERWSCFQCCRTTTTRSFHWDLQMRRTDLEQCNQRHWKWSPLLVVLSTPPATQVNCKPSTESVERPTCALYTKIWKFKPVPRIAHPSMEPLSTGSYARLLWLILNRRTAADAMTLDGPSGLLGWGADWATGAAAFVGAGAGAATGFCSASILHCFHNETIFGWLNHDTGTYLIEAFLLGSFGALYFKASPKSIDAPPLRPKKNPLKSNIFQQRILDTQTYPEPMENKPLKPDMISRTKTSRFSQKDNNSHTKLLLSTREETTDVQPKRCWIRHFPSSYACDRPWRYFIINSHEESKQRSHL